LVTLTRGNHRIHAAVFSPDCTTSAAGVELNNSCDDVYLWRSAAIDAPMPPRR
jgi:hypothetical protein